MTKKEPAPEAEAKIGHNSGESPSAEVQNMLRSFIERVERLADEKAVLGLDIRDVFAEAKANGFDIKAMREIIRLRHIDPSERREHDEIVATYMNALGMM